MSICYFFIRDRVKSGELAVEYCTTGEMLTDHFTKLLQGEAFYKFWSMIMNMDPGLTCADSAQDKTISFSPSPQECVGDLLQDPSHHAKNYIHMSCVKDHMGSAKDFTESANQGDRGVGVKIFGHETVLHCTLICCKEVCEV